jgi:hypothetical protein
LWQCGEGDVVDGKNYEIGFDQNGVNYIIMLGSMRVIQKIHGLTVVGAELWEPSETVIPPVQGWAERNPMTYERGVEECPESCLGRAARVLRDHRRAL